MEENILETACRRAGELLGMARQVVFLSVSPLPQSPPGSLHGYSRLLIPLSGSILLECSAEHRAGIREFVPGDAVFAPPYAWSTHHWDRRGELLSLSFRADYLRFLYLNCDGMGVPGDDPAERFFRHTANGGGSTLCRLVGVLNSCADDPSVHAPELLRILFEESVSLLKADGGTEPAGRARHTWLMLREYVREHFTGELDRRDVARRFSLHPGHVSRLFREQGEGFGELVRRLRIERARKLLEGTTLSVKEIAECCGFQNAGYFIKAFRRETGTTPGAFRRCRK